MVRDGKNLKGWFNDAIASACLSVSCLWTRRSARNLQGKLQFQKSQRKKLAGVPNSFGKHKILWCRLSIFSSNLFITDIARALDIVPALLKFNLSL